jgi:hypothetical protein
MTTFSPAGFVANKRAVIKIAGQGMMPVTVMYCDLSGFWISGDHLESQFLHECPPDDKRMLGSPVFFVPMHRIEWLAAPPVQ